jgi:ribosome-binding factor A
MLRSRLSKIMKIRRVPKLSFRFDESIEYSSNIEELLNKIR